jgi:hypothetical protein
MPAGSEKAMDTRLTNSVPYPSLAPVRPEAAPVRNAVRTDLAPPQAVAAQAGAEQTRFSRNARRDASGGETIRNESSVTTDRETGDLVYQVIDPESRAVVSQYPYEAVLKLRAYLQQVEGGSDR